MNNSPAPGSPYHYDSSKPVIQKAGESHIYPSQVPGSSDGSNNARAFREEQAKRQWNNGLNKK